MGVLPPVILKEQALLKQGLTPIENLGVKTAVSANVNDRYVTGK